jgi:hypothetical protein
LRPFVQEVLENEGSLSINEIELMVRKEPISDYTDVSTYIIITSNSRLRQIYGMSCNWSTSIIEESSYESKIESAE